MFEPEPIPAYRSPKRFWRVSKYLFPGDRTAIFPGRAPAPTRALRPHAFARKYPELVRIHSLGTEGDWGDIPFRTIYRGELSVQIAEAHPDFVQQVTSYQNAGAVGRHSSLIGPENTLVAEPGYFQPDASYIRKVPLGRMNPRHWRYRWQGDLRNRESIPTARRVEGTAVVLNNPWCHNYYHWLLEVAARVLLLRRTGLTADWYVVECQSRYQQQVLELLGVPRQRCIQPHYGLHLRADCILRPSQPGTQAWREMSAAIKASASVPVAGAETKRRRIYISRKSASHRKLANEQELEQLLIRYGFESHRFEEYDFARQVELMSNAEIVVAVHGAALANLVFAQPGTRVVEICPVNRYNADCFPRISHKMGLDHVTVMATSTRFRQHLQVEMADVNMALDLLGLRHGNGHATGLTQVA